MRVFRPLIQPLIPLAVLALIPLQPQRAAASTATGTMAVSATVATLCTVTALPLAFGTYSAAQTDAATTLAVLCTNGTSYNIGMDAGTGAGATTASRLMTGTSGATLAYALYSNAGRSTNWGSTVGTDTLAGTGTGLPQTVNVYGRIAAGQYPAPGIYTDTVTVTLTY